MDYFSVIAVLHWTHNSRFSALFIIDQVVNVGQVGLRDLASLYGNEMEVT